MLGMLEDGTAVCAVAATRSSSTTASSHALPRRRPVVLHKPLSSGRLPAMAPIIPLPLSPTPRRRAWTPVRHGSQATPPWPPSTSSYTGSLSEPSPSTSLPPWVHGHAPPLPLLGMLESGCCVAVLPGRTASTTLMLPKERPRCSHGSVRVLPKGSGGASIGVAGAIEGRRWCSHGEDGAAPSGGRCCCIGSVFSMKDAKGLAVSLGELQVEPSPSRQKDVDRHGNGDGAAANDDTWDGDDILDQDSTHRKNLFVKMGYREGIAEGKNDAGQEGFKVGFGQAVHVGFKWGLVRGITSALDGLPNRLKEKVLLDDQSKGKLKDLHNSVKQISADGALQLFHETILQDNRTPEESRLQSIPKDLLSLLHECPDVRVPQELTRVP